MNGHRYPSTPSPIATAAANAPPPATACPSVLLALSDGFTASASLSVTAEHPISFDLRHEGREAPINVESHPGNH
ncbi:hypothetical protein HMPREF1549_00524 [Actinomyces johnsonii F0510]|uniref:Uncharacterized protein n=1 Tax=Actinomyces johnsonii F0510 TaxID=1227262 RepID=U1RPX8_9ACTO|nr:hypothetical protein HMPREF1549_00524 [Actinomyces johnsonii F0510]